MYNSLFGLFRLEIEKEWDIINCEHHRLTYKNQYIVFYTRNKLTNKIKSALQNLPLQWYLNMYVNKINMDEFKPNDMKAYDYKCMFGKKQVNNC